MDLKAIRPLLKPLSKERALKDQTVVIDGKSFFGPAYKASGCQFIYGGEYDRYAAHLQKMLKCFKDCSITCLVIIKAAKESGVDERLEIHQKVIDRANMIVPGKEDEYLEPICAKDVIKQVLEQMDIKYVVCEYDDLPEIVNVSKYYRCPVITSYIEYTLLGLNCVSPQSISHNANAKEITAKMYHATDCHARVCLANDKMAIYLILVDEGNEFLPSLEHLIKYKRRNLAPPLLLVWMKRQTRDQLLNDIKMNLEKSKYEKFMTIYKAVKNLVFQDYDKKSLAIAEFSSQNSNVGGWWTNGVAAGRIAPCYVNLKHYDLFSGSWFIFDDKKDDAMLPSIEIVQFAQELIKDCKQNKIAFLCREGGKSCQKNIISSDKLKQLKFAYTYDDVFINTQNLDYFSYFIRRSLPGFDVSILMDVPQDVRLLIVALLFYFVKRNQYFLKGVHSVLLCYVMVAHVSKTTGLLKRNNLISSTEREGKSGSSRRRLGINQDSKITAEDCSKAASAVIDLFYVSNVKNSFKRDVVHTFAEFEHCLLQMNYLNKLCGERIPCTTYHEVYNATFVYNVYLILTKAQDPLKIVKKYLEHSKTVWNFYKTIIDTFDECVKSCVCHRLVI